MMNSFFLDSGVIEVDFESGVFGKIISNGSVINNGKTDLFAVKLRNRNAESIVMSACKFRFVDFDGGAATYSSDLIDVVIRCTPSEDKNSFLVRADVKNKTDMLIEWVELISPSVFGKLCDEKGGKGAIVYPFNEGGFVTDMVYRESMPYKYTEPDYPSKSGYSIFPNMICSQFLAYICDNSGLYLGMHDSERTTKHIDFRYADGNIKLQMRTFCDVDYGQDYAMPYDCVVRPFVGDWHDSCEIYRAWFDDNLPDGLKKISRNETLPDWYDESPVTVIYPIRGRKDTGDMTPGGMFPYENALPFLRETAKETNSPIMALLMHWEGTAPWAPPYSWPPFGGEKMFCDFLKQAHKENIKVGLYMSGMGYTVKSNIIADYDKSADFERENISDIACSDSNGKIESTICPSQRKGYDLCPACEQTKRIMVNEIDKLCAAGVDYVQALDQNHGGCGYFCYSDKHGHTPAPGKWQWHETGEMLDEVKHERALLGCETAASEPMISRLPYNDSRFQLNLYVGAPIPLYSYIYHEYVNNFMGNQICAMANKADNNFTYRLAYSFIAGDMLSIVTLGDGKIEFSWCDWIAPQGKTVDKNVAFAFIRTLNGWRQGAAGKYLHLGRMVKPLKVFCDKQQFTLDDGSVYTPDSVLSSAYAVEGKTMQFVVNYNLQSVTISFPCPVKGYSDCNFTKPIAETNKMTLEPLSVVALVLD